MDGPHEGAKAGGLSHHAAKSYQGHPCLRGVQTAASLNSAGYYSEGNRHTRATLTPAKPCAIVGPAFFESEATGVWLEKADRFLCDIPFRRSGITSSPFTLGSGPHPSAQMKSLTNQLQIKEHNMKKINGWNRIFIVISILWLIGNFFCSGKILLESKEIQSIAKKEKIESQEIIKKILLLNPTWKDESISLTNFILNAKRYNRSDSKEFLQEFENNLNDNYFSTLVLKYCEKKQIKKISN